MRLIFVCLCLFLVSCSKVAEHTSVTIYQYGIGGELQRTEADRLKIEVSEYDRTYQYTSDIVKQDSRTDSVILYFSEQCKLRGEKTFHFGDTKYNVKRYILDSAEEEDDAGAIFFLDEYGIIAIKSIDWGYHRFYDRGYQYNQFIIDYLKSDTSEFFGKIPRGNDWRIEERLK